MSYIHYPRQTVLPRRRRYPLLVFLFLTAGFFLSAHDPSGAQRTVDDYNRPQDEIVQGVSSGSMVRQVALVGLGAASVLSLLSYSAPRRFHASGSAYVLCAFAAWAMLSSLWADDPAMTIKRLTAFGILCVVAITVVRMFSLREIIMWVFFATATFLLVAIAVEILVGAFRPWSSGYRFAGLQHPNGEGIECGLLVLSGIAGCRVDRQRLWLYRSFACVAVMFLLLTGSRTSIIATVVGVAVYWIMSSSKGSGKVIVISAVVLTCLILVSLVTGLMPVVSHALSVQRDEGAGTESFGGRTQIWQDVTSYILRRPLVGHGYGGFWTPEHISAISDEEKWGVPDSHSAYVDYLLTIGAVGLALYVGCLIQGLWKSLSMSRVSKDIAFLTGILIFGAIDGFFESSIGEGSLLMLLCMIALVWLSFVPASQPKASVPRLVYKQEVLAQQ